MRFCEAMVLIMKCYWLSLGTVLRPLQILTHNPHTCEENATIPILRKRNSVYGEVNGTAGIQTLTSRGYP